MTAHTFDPSDWHERPQVSEEPPSVLSEYECGSGFLVSPGDRAVAFALVAAELARHLALQLDGRNSMADDAEAREALDAFCMIRAAMVNEAAQ
jgi:hypothetical protein